MLISFSLVVVEENLEIQVKETLRMRVFESQPNNRSGTQYQKIIHVSNCFAKQGSGTELRVLRPKQ